MKNTSVNFRLLSSFDNTSFLLSTANYQYFSSKPKKSILHPSIQLLFPELIHEQKRNISIIGTDDYSRSVRRAFSRAKLLAFFNLDLTEFITLTYKDNMQNPAQLIRDIKMLVKQTKRTSNITPKYIYTIEKQKRGALHVHMIANKAFRYQINKNTRLELKDWHKGFTNVQTLSNFDNDFKTYLYLFKYMGKAQRVGSTFIHCSRGFDKTKVCDYRNYINVLTKENLLYQEDCQFTLENRECSINKSYFRTKDGNLL